MSRFRDRPRKTGSHKSAAVQDQQQLAFHRIRLLSGAFRGKFSRPDQPVQEHLVAFGDTNISIRAINEIRG